jgi:hypothetical protein
MEQHRAKIPNYRYRHRCPKGGSMTLTRYLVPSLAAIVACGLCAVTATMNVTNAVTLSGGWETTPGQIAGGAALVIEAAKALGLVAVGVALSRRKYIGAVVWFLVWLGAFACSLASVIEFNVAATSDIAGRRADTASSNSALSAQLDAELKRLGWLNTRVRDARGKDLDRATTEFDKSRAQIDALRTQLASSTGPRVANPLSDLWQRLGLPGDIAALMKSLGAVLILELLAAIAPAGVRSIWPARSTPTQTSATVVTTPALTVPVAIEPLAESLAHPTVATIAAPAPTPPAPLRVVGGTAMVSPPQAATAATVASVMPAITRSTKPISSKGPLALAFDSSADPLEAVENVPIERLVLTAATVLPFPAHAEVATVTPADPVATFAATRIERRDGSQVQASTLHDSFVAWCRATGNEPLNATVFGLAMGALGFSKIKTSRVHYCNIALMN